MPCKITVYCVGDDGGRSLHFIIRMLSNQEAPPSFDPSLFDSVDAPPVGPNSIFIVSEEHLGSCRVRNQKCVSRSSEMIGLGREVGEEEDCEERAGEIMAGGGGR